MDNLYFLEIFNKAEKKYGSYKKRLAGEGWDSCWKTLIVTIMSAQSRDETTISIAENLFLKYPNLKELAEADFKVVLNIFGGLNYNKTKSRNVISAARFIIDNYGGEIPDTMEDLLKIPGVGRKTANLVLSECFNLPSITVDTHVHRICNVFGFVNSKTSNETEAQLKAYIPEAYWSKINRIFVLWGKEVRGASKERFLKKLDE